VARCILGHGAIRGLDGGAVPTSSDAPPELAARAAALVRQYPECFWYWRPEAPVRSVEDVRLVVRQLREYGGRDAWLAARDLSECLSPRSRRTS
jgi:hypothetical protein